MHFYHTYYDFLQTRKMYVLYDYAPLYAKSKRNDRRHLSGSRVLTPFQKRHCTLDGTTTPYLASNR